MLTVASWIQEKCGVESRRVERDIANILHRDTIAVIVGSQMFDRGKRCFAEKRVQEVTASAGGSARSDAPSSASAAALRDRKRATDAPPSPASRCIAVAAVGAA